jgi:hypothetical protein
VEDEDFHCYPPSSSFFPHFSLSIVDLIFSVLLQLLFVLSSFL